MSQFVSSYIQAKNSVTDETADSFGARSFCLLNTWINIALKMLAVYICSKIECGGLENMPGSFTMHIYFLY